MNDQEHAQLTIIENNKLSLIDVLYGCAIVPEVVLKETDLIKITTRKFLKDKIIIEKVLMFCDLDDFYSKTKAIIEYE